MAILNRRGNESDFDATKMLPGEWAVSLDTRYVRMCFAPGICLRMATYEAFENDMEEIKDILSKSQNIQQVVTAINANVNSKAEIVVERTAEAEKYRDEAKMYAENASAVSGVEIATKERAGIIKGGDNYISPDGTLQLITTTSSTTLPNSHAGRLKFNEIVGDIEQDSTEGNQLFDSSVLLGRENNGVTFTNNGDGSFSVIGTTSDEAIARTAMVELELTSGTYTISGNKDNATVIIQVIDSEGNVSYYHESSSIGGTFTLDGTEQTVNFYIQVQVGLTVNTTVYPMLNAGTTALPWEPFTNGASPNPDYPQDINGSVISGVRVHGEQLFDASATPYTKKHDYSFDKESGNYTFKSSTKFLMNRWRIKVKPNTDITITAKEISPSVIVQISNLSLDGTIDVRLNSGTLKKTFNTLDFTELSISIFLNADNSDTLVANGIMVSYDAAATYEPYQGKEITLSNPITLYNDVMSAKEIERKYVKFTANSSMVNSATKDGTVYINVSTKVKVSTKAYCTHNSNVKASLSGATLYFTDSVNGVDADTYKSFLDNNVVEFLCELATPTTETLPTADQIALNSLPTFDGVTYVEFIDMGVQPSVSIDYGTSKIGGMTLEGLLAGINGELQSKLNNDRITALESAVVNNV